MPAATSISRPGHLCRRWVEKAAFYAARGTAERAPHRAGADHEDAEQQRGIRRVRQRPGSAMHRMPVASATHSTLGGPNRVASGTTRKMLINGPNSANDDANTASAGLSRRTGVQVRRECHWSVDLTTGLAGQDLVPAACLQFCRSIFSSVRPSSSDPRYDRILLRSQNQVPAPPPSTSGRACSHGARSPRLYRNR